MAQVDARAIAVQQWRAAPELTATPDRRDTALWRADSLRAWRDRQVVEPREVARVQALQHCITTLSFDRGGSEMELLDVTAYADGLAVLGTSWMYRSDGYSRGSRVSVVIPNTQCGHIRRLGFGATSVRLPWLEHADTARENAPGSTASIRRPTTVRDRGAVAGERGTSGV
ncbi:MAG TPA: hypothetical protein VK358_16290 [Longimicrobium sp.]|nr:hypothetical protein [Longimicrobium sp.]